MPKPRPKPRLITPEKLGEFARNLLDFLDGEKIETIGDIFSRLEKDLTDKRKDNIILDSQFSESEGEIYRINYIDYGLGIPIEIRMNHNRDYFEIKVKVNSILDYYTSTSSDNFGNYRQNKKIKGCTILEIKKELENLVS